MSTNDERAGRSPDGLRDLEPSYKPGSPALDDSLHLKRVTSPIHPLPFCLMPHVFVGDATHLAFARNVVDRLNDELGTEQSENSFVRGVGVAEWTYKTLPGIGAFPQGCPPADVSRLGRDTVEALSGSSDPQAVKLAAKFSAAGVLNVEELPPHLVDLAYDVVDCTMGGFSLLRVECDTPISLKREASNGAPNGGTDMAEKWYHVKTFASDRPGTELHGIIGDGDLDLAYESFGYIALCTVEFRYQMDGTVVIDGRALPKLRMVYDPLVRRGDPQWVVSNPSIKDALDRLAASGRSAYGLDVAGLRDADAQGFTLCRPRAIAPNSISSSLAVRAQAGHALTSLKADFPETFVIRYSSDIEDFANGGLDEGLQVVLSDFSSHERLITSVLRDAIIIKVEDVYGPAAANELTASLLAPIAYRDTDWTTGKRKGFINADPLQTSSFVQNYTNNSGNPWTAFLAAIGAVYHLASHWANRGVLSWRRGPERVAALRDILRHRRTVTLNGRTFRPRQLINGDNIARVDVDRDWLGETGIYGESTTMNGLVLREAFGRVRASPNPLSALAPLFSPSRSALAVQRGDVTRSWKDRRQLFNDEYSLQVIDTAESVFEGLTGVTVTQYMARHAGFFTDEKKRMGLMIPDDLSPDELAVLDDPDLLLWKYVGENRKKVERVAHLVADTVPASVARAMMDISARCRTHGRRWALTSHLQRRSSVRQRYVK